ncbi:MAG: LON peptidase substrate-binding domain-containing protein, partial [Oscillospiraceae bacterium]|nr:LON peptidase substrate-binding domain-containing protein [Oscillospiraceae bacterium]
MSKTTITKSLPILALRGIVLFPEMVLHFDVARKKSKAAVRAAMKDSREIFLITQRRIKTEDPQIKDLFSMGVIAEIKQIIKIPDSDTIRLVIEGKSRGEIAELTDENPYLKGIIRERRSGPPRDADYEKALIRHIRDVFDKYAQVTHMSPDVILSVMESDKACTLSDYIASVLTVDYTQKQMILSELGAIKRLEKISRLLIRETGLLEIEDKIAQKVGNQIDKNQREYYLREKMKAISSELGDVEDELNEMQLFYERIKNARMAGSSKEKLLKECMRLAKIGMSFSSEAAVIRGYLEICLDLPWGIFTNDNLNLKKAQKILDQEHYGLEKVKKRIIEFLAVRRLSPHIKGQIICLVGPPGVGKTSIAKSLAAAMGRNFARISLGGVRDIAEIRGHRKTYVGAMPGRIISAISSVKSSNPLILLDEIDKLSADYKGDPSSALLEVL